MPHDEGSPHEENEEELPHSGETRSGGHLPQSPPLVPLTLRPSVRMHVSRIGGRDCGLAGMVVQRDSNRGSWERPVGGESAGGPGGDGSPQESLVDLTAADSECRELGMALEVAGEEEHSGSPVELRLEQGLWEPEHLGLSVFKFVDLKLGVYAPQALHIQRYEICVSEKAETFGTFGWSNSNGFEKIQIVYR